MRRPDICIPITDTTRDEIIARAAAFAELPVQMVEWRIDYFEGEEKEIPGMTEELKRILGDKKLVATLRTVFEGGEENGNCFDYEGLLVELAGQGAADFLDVEIKRTPKSVNKIIAAAGRTETKVIGSCHDFFGTPPKEELLQILNQARELGADVGKLACMPSENPEQSERDVQAILHATSEMKQNYPEFPLITMCMGEAGRITRMYGGLYGSDVSFGCAGSPSAPGQIEWEKMKEVFDKLYAGRNHISLIGFMGVGKSAVSHELHRITGRQEIDTDQKIVENEGCSISDIFATKGEPYFRQLETDLLDEIGEMPDGIVSCGGGMAMRELNVKKLQAMGNIVLLTAEPETIYKRVRNSNDRPLLNGNMNVPYIRELMEKRRPFYESASTVTVATDDRTVREIAEEILVKCT